MRRRSWVLFATGLLLLAGVLAYRQRRLHVSVHPEPASVMAGEPRLMLWAWETPEDLGALDPHKAGVAFLSREVLLGTQVVVRPRRQPLHVPAETWLVAVVRLEPTASFASNGVLQQQALRAVLGALTQPGVRGLQIDFDATQSQQGFYLELLRSLRAALPSDFPLSITALVSWCGPRSWLATPQLRASVDEAVPMFFRMGGPAATRATRPRSGADITAPICRGSVGLSTDEAWPAVDARQRVYLFRPGPWTKKDLAQLDRFGYVGLHESHP